MPKDGHMGLVCEIMGRHPVTPALAAVRASDAQVGDGVTPTQVGHECVGPVGAGWQLGVVVDAG